MQRTASLPRATTTPLWERPAAGLGRLRERLADPADRPLLLWRAFWAPFWAWSDAPAPGLPRREQPLPDEVGPAGQAVTAGIDRIRRRLWLSHGAAYICRGIWLGLVFASLLMLLDLAGGPAFDPRPALALGGVLLAAGVVLAALCQPSRARTARMLDRSFHLHERLTTGLDDLGLGVPGPGERAPVVYLQMADAANAMAALRHNRRLRPAIPVREVVLAVLMGLILATLAFVRGLGGGLPVLEAAHVPIFTPAIERPANPEPTAAEIEAAELAPTVQEVLDRSESSARARRDLQQLAAALADHAVTRPAAEQIAQGNYDAASDQLREAASQASELSEGARGGLADDLNEAARQMQPETSGLHEATRDAAAGLQVGDEPARQEMSDLADAVRQAGDQVIPQEELASQMRDAQQSQAQGGQSASQPGSMDPNGEMSSSSARSSISGDPGSGADARSSSRANDAQQSSSQDPAAGQGQAGSDAGQQGGAGESGRANAPGEGDQPGPGEGGPEGQAANSEGENGQASSGDSDVSREGGGAGTGSGDERNPAEGGASGENMQAGAGEQAADPNVSGSSTGEADPSALDGANQQVALPAGTGQQGVQTSANSGSALRGSGAGVTAGSGYAVQGEVGEAGPDSNRVPPEHRETVERYFSAGRE